MTSTTTGTPSPSDDELARLNGELIKAKAKLQEWSNAVEEAIRQEQHEGKLGRFERERAFHLGRVTALEARVTALEAQITGKYYSFVNKRQRTNRSHH